MSSWADALLYSVIEPDSFHLLNGNRYRKRMTSWVLMRFISIVSLYYDLSSSLTELYTSTTSIDATTTDDLWRTTNAKPLCVLIFKMLELSAEDVLSVKVRYIIMPKPFW
jgi:hypothetical protein